MARLDIISEITSRLAPAGVKYFLSVANDSATGAFVVIRQDDPSDTKSKDAIVATRCDVLMIVCGDNQAQVSGAMGKVCTTFENVDTEVNGVGLRIRCESPGKVDTDGDGMFWQEVVVKVVVTY